MSDRAVERTLEEADARMRELHERAGSPAIHLRGVLPETFEELQIALEELRVASEELRQQNEAIIDAQTQLTEEHNRYLELFHSAPDAYVITDSYGLISQANVAAAQMTGIEQRYLHNKPLANCIARYDRDRFRTFVTVLQSTTETQHWSLDVQSRSGEITAVDISASPIRGRPGATTGVRWLLRDVSSRREAEQQRSLRETERIARTEAERSHWQLAQILERITDPFFHLSREGVFTIANARCQGIWEKPREEMIGKTFEEVVPGSAQTDFCRSIFLAADRQEATHFEAICPGLGIWVDVNAYPVLDGVAVYFRDISAQKLEKALAEREQDKNRRVADILQTTLLSDRGEREYDGMQIGCAYAPALDEAVVGGDYFDVFRVGSQRKIALIVGDVTGKGLDAAAYIAQMKYALRAFLWELDELGSVLARFNDFLCSVSAGPDSHSRLLALTVALIDEQSHQVQMASAGAEPALVVRQDGEIEICDSRGMLIGVEPGQTYTHVDWMLEEGDTLLLATDGLIEARRKGGSQFGIEGVRDFLQSLPAECDAQECAEDILASVKKYTGGELHDDVCILLAKRRRKERDSEQTG